MYDVESIRYNSYLMMLKMCLNALAINRQSYDEDSIYCNINGCCIVDVRADN